MGFAEDTTVTAVAPGRYESAVREGWDIAGNANGGYLLALAARAMLDHSGRADPVTISAHYLSPGRVGPVDIECRTV